MASEIKKSSTNFENLKLLNESCNVNVSLKNIGLRWKMQILYCILNEESRYGRLKQIFPTISDQVLSKRLNELHKEQLVTKTKIDNIKPAQYQYTITPKGKELIEIILKLKQWTSRWEL